jgi:hypothetical protein
VNARSAPASQRAPHLEPGPAVVSPRTGWRQNSASVAPTARTPQLPPCSTKRWGGRGKIGRWFWERDFENLSVRCFHEVHKCFGNEHFLLLFSEPDIVLRTFLRGIRVCFLLLEREVSNLFLFLYVCNVNVVST